MTNNTSLESSYAVLLESTKEKQIKKKTVLLNPRGYILKSEGKNVK